MAGEADPERLDAVTQRLKAAAVQEDLSPRRQALKDLADAARDLVDRLVATDAPDDVIVAATAEVRRRGRPLRGLPPGHAVRVLARRPTPAPARTRCSTTAR